MSTQATAKATATATSFFMSTLNGTKTVNDKNCFTFSAAPNTVSKLNEQVKKLGDEIESSSLYQPRLLPPLLNPTPAASAPSSACSQFIDPSKLIELSKKALVILLDCRTYTEFNTKHIKDSVHLNCRDKLIKKRLQARKLTVKDLISCEEIKSKLDSNEDELLVNASKTSAAFNTTAALAAAAANIVSSSTCKIINRLSSCNSLSKLGNEDEHDVISGSSNLLNSNDINKNMIVIYDDTTSDVAELQSESNPLKIVQENIKQSGYKKECKILKGGFKQFFSAFPEFCVNKQVLSANFSSSYEPQIDQQQSAIENAVMTEILPHLYLGNFEITISLDEIFFFLDWRKKYF